MINFTQFQIDANGIVNGTKNILIQEITHLMVIPRGNILIQQLR